MLSLLVIPAIVLIYYFKKFQFSWPGFLIANITSVLLCIVSLLLASIFTVFIMIITGLNLNFANMIALPLLYSLGVSYPIYFMRRFFELGKVDKVILSNTPSAIFFSAATTTASFATLGMSSHNGTSSMGILLFISLLMTLLSSLVLLPLMIKFFNFENKSL